MAGSQHHKGGDFLSALGVRETYHRRLRHGGVFDERALDIERSYPVARCSNDVVPTAHKGEMQILRVIGDS